MCLVEHANSGAWTALRGIMQLSPVAHGCLVQEHRWAQRSLFKTAGRRVATTTLCSPAKMTPACAECAAGGGPGVNAGRMRSLLEASGAIACQAIALVTGGSPCSSHRHRLALFAEAPRSLGRHPGNARRAAECLCGQKARIITMSCTYSTNHQRLLPLQSTTQGWSASVAAPPSHTHTHTTQQ